MLINVTREEETKGYITENYSTIYLKLQACNVVAADAIKDMVSFGLQMSTAL